MCLVFRLDLKKIVDDIWGLCVGVGSVIGVQVGSVCGCGSIFRILWGPNDPMGIEKSDHFDFAGTFK